MLNILGTLAGNILGLPGILGLALGMMTRNFAVAAVLGGIGLAGACVICRRELRLFLFGQHIVKRLETLGFAALVFDGQGFLLALFT